MNEYDLVSAGHGILVTHLHVFLGLTSFIMFQKGKTKSAQRVTAVFHCVNGFQFTCKFREGDFSNTNVILKEMRSFHDNLSLCMSLQ